MIFHASQSAPLRSKNGHFNRSYDDSAFSDIELFAGGGGMSIGLRMAGFTPADFHEADEFCCQTLARNTSGKRPTLQGKVVRGQAEDIDWSIFADKVRLLAGGAPCQPFSLAGRHNSHRDPRNLFPELLRAVRETRPQAVLLENVRGIVRKSFRAYFEYVVRQLRFPSVFPKRGESWRDHDRRLKKIELIEAPEYNVVFRIVDAADFGVPQNRLRVFIVATRLGIPPYIFPKNTHSRVALERALRGKAYWEYHAIKRPHLQRTAPLMNQEGISLLPWCTVRDAFRDLPPPASREQDAAMNHWSIPGARSYRGHTGSRMDWPAKTVKAGVHGVPGGENTVIDIVGAFRYFTLRETARLQTFPDRHFFIGSRSQVTRQIGNAVPTQLAEIIARPLYKLLREYAGGKTASACRDKKIKCA